MSDDNEVRNDNAKADIVQSVLDKKFSRANFLAFSTSLEARFLTLSNSAAALRYLSQFSSDFLADNSNCSSTVSSISSFF